MPDEEKLRRVILLRHWLVGMGCCSVCALGFAISQVEREGGAPFEAPSACPRGAESECTTRARAGWKTMPLAVEAPPPAAPARAA